MNNSWNLGSVGGINLRVHWTFILLPIWIYFSSVIAGSGVAMAVTSVLFVLAIFGCVLLHELGHAMAAKQFGIKTRHITLLPIGGVAALERMPRAPLQELWIAVAGPLVNVVIAAALFCGLMFNIVAPASMVGQFLWQLTVANIVLVVFNMIPAFPMDGGRVLRSLLAMFMEYVKATQIAATVGQFFAIALGLAGLFSGQFMLIFVAGFVYLAAKAESMQVAGQLRNTRAGFPNQAQPFNPFAATKPTDVDQTERVWFRDEQAVPATLPVSSVAIWLANQHREFCAVEDSGRVIGKISRSQLIAAIHRGWGRVPVGQLVMS